MLKTLYDGRWKSQKKLNKLLHNFIPIQASSFISEEPATATAPKSLALEMQVKTFAMSQQQDTF